MEQKKIEQKSKIGVLFKSVLAAYIVTIVILLLLALFMFKMNLSNEGARIGIIISYIVSAFAGGFLAGKTIKERRFLWGGIVGILYFVIVFVISCILNKNIGAGGGNLFTVFAMCMFGGMLGGMLS